MSIITMIDETDRQTQLNHQRCFLLFRKHFIRITSLDSPSHSEFILRRGQRSWNTVAPSPRKSTGRLAHGHMPCAQPGLRGLQEEAQAASRIEHSTLKKSSCASGCVPTHPSSYLLRYCPVPGAGSGPGAHDEQGSENPAHGEVTSAITHTSPGGAGQQSHTRPGEPREQQSHTPSGEARGSSHTRAGRRAGARGRRVHSDRSGAPGPLRAALPGRLIRVSPQVTVLSFHQAASHHTATGPSQLDPGLCTVILVLSCNKLSVAREKKPQCVSGPHYLGRTLGTVHSASPSYRPGSFQRATMPQTTHKTAPGLQVQGTCHPTFLAGFLQTAPCRPVPSNDLATI